VSSNRTEHASGEGSVHVFSVCVAQIHAADPSADKPVPDMRRGDRSCGDWTAPSARQFWNSRLSLRRMWTHQILGRASRAAASTGDV